MSLETLPDASKNTADESLDLLTADEQKDEADLKNIEARIQALDKIITERERSRLRDVLDLVSSLKKVRAERAKLEGDRQIKLTLLQARRRIMPKLDLERKGI